MLLFFIKIIVGLLVPTNLGNHKSYIEVVIFKPCIGLVGAAVGFSLLDVGTYTGGRSCIHLPKFLRKMFNTNLHLKCLLMK